jgi:hypothetical protein
MKLLEDSNGWHIEGAGSERARIAFASEENGKLVLSLEGSRKRGPSNTQGAEFAACPSAS